MNDTMIAYLISRMCCLVCNLRDTELCGDTCLVGRIGMKTMKECTEMMTDE